MEPPGRCGDWLAPPPSPPRAHAPGRHDERGVGTSTWPPAGTYTWPSARTFPWPWTRRDVRLRVEREPNGPALLVSGVLLDGLVTAADEAFSVQNDTTEDGVVQPAGPQRSGSPESLVPWQSLGRQGRTFAATGSAAPTTAARGRRCRCCRTCCSPGSDTVTLDLDLTPRLVPLLPVVDNDRVGRVLDASPHPGDRRSPGRTAVLRGQCMVGNRARTCVGRLTPSRRC